MYSAHVPLITISPKKSTRIWQDCPHADSGGNAKQATKPLQKAMQNA